MVDHVTWLQMEVQDHHIREILDLPCYCPSKREGNMLLLVIHRQMKYSRVKRLRKTKKIPKLRVIELYDGMI